MTAETYDFLMDIIQEVRIDMKSSKSEFERGMLLEQFTTILKANIPEPITE